MYLFQNKNTDDSIVLSASSIDHMHVFAKHPKTPVVYSLFKGLVVKAVYLDHKQKRKLSPSGFNLIMSLLNLTFIIHV